VRFFVRRFQWFRWSFFSVKLFLRHDELNTLGFHSIVCYHKSTLLSIGDEL
jgi:hypothetical protein